MRRTSQPHSSRTSRRAASSVVSPSSTSPPGTLHLPAAGGPPRRTSSTRRPWKTTAPTPTRGWSGYSRLTPGARGERSRRGGEPGRGGVPVADERVDPLRLLGAQPAGAENQAVLGRKGRLQRGRDLVEAGTATERRLERRQRRERIDGGGKHRAQPRRVHAEQDGAVLQERRPLAALRTAHELASADLDLVPAGAGEAE